jgi:hypothetical protein
VAGSNDRRKKRAEKIQEELALVYTPSTPIAQPKLFSGRNALLADLHDELTTKGTHLVLFGERGVGKTSLWQVVLHGKKVARHSASELDDFVSIFFRVLERLGEQFTPDQRKQLAETSSSIGAEKVASFGSKVGAEDVERPIAQRTLDLNYVLERVAGRDGELDAIVIDEFQNIRNPDVQTQIIEVVKGFTDHDVDVRLVITGVADSDDELLTSREYQQYKGRHFFAHRVPRMSGHELRDILDVREKRYRVKFDDDAKDTIATVAAGYPGVAHRLALLASRQWVTAAFLETTLSVASIVAPLFGGIASILSATIAVSRTVLVKRAGVHVTNEDVRLAVDRYVRKFSDDHRKAVERYEHILLSPRLSEIEGILTALAASPTAHVSTDELARDTELPAAEVTALLQSEAAGLVEEFDGRWRLAVRQFRTFMEARRYLGDEELPVEEPVGEPPPAR